MVFNGLKKAYLDFSVHVKGLECLTALNNWVYPSSGPFGIGLNLQNTVPGTRVLLLQYKKILSFEVYDSCQGLLALQHNLMLNAQSLSISL